MSFRFRVSSFGFRVNSKLKTRNLFYARMAELVDALV